MANTSLPNLTERTATANSDLIHVNSGGTDYKETKANFLSDVNSSITSLNNSLTNSSIGGASAITLDSSQSSADINNFRIVKNGKIIMVWAQIGSLNVTAGANTIGTIPSGYRPYTNCSWDGYMGAGGERGTAVRVAIDSSGVLRIYASATISSTLRGTMIYISA